MCHKGGENDHDAEHIDASSSSLKAEFSKTKDKDMVDKDVINQLLKRL